MKKYLLFVWDTYYPDGGWNDLAGEFDTLQEIKKFLISINFEFDPDFYYENFQIIDTFNGAIVESPFEAD